MTFLIGLLGGVVGAAATIGSVWFSQYLHDLRESTDRLAAAGREAAEKFSLLLEGIDRTTGQLQLPWREDFYAFGRLYTEVDVLLVKLRRLNHWPWQRSKRQGYVRAEQLVQEFQERFAAATALLGRGKPLSDEAIAYLTATLSRAARSWLDDSGTYDPDAELQRFLEHARYYMREGIDAAPPTD